MAAWPTYARLEAAITETRESALLREAVESGPPKQRRTKSRVMVTLAGTVLFRTHGQDWFDFVHPRTGAIVQARFVGGSELGAGEYLRSRGSLIRQPVTLEYWSA
jgi:hypothetical protein